MARPVSVGRQTGKAEVNSIQVGISIMERELQEVEMVTIGFSEQRPVSRPRGRRASKAAGARTTRSWTD